MKVFEPNFYII